MTKNYGKTGARILYTEQVFFGQSKIRALSFLSPKKYGADCFLCEKNTGHQVFMRKNDCNDWKRLIKRLKKYGPETFFDQNIRGRDTEKNMGRLFWPRKFRCSGPRFPLIFGHSLNELHTYFFIRIMFFVEAWRYS